MAHFARHGLAIEDENGWRFAPANQLLERRTAQLAALYRERPISTIGLIARADPLRSLAEAFLIQRDET